MLRKQVVLSCAIVLFWVFVVLGGVVVAGYAQQGWNAWRAYAGYLKYEPQEGDVIFQSLPYGPVVLAIEGVTKSPYTHCGIVGKLRFKKGADYGTVREGNVYEEWVVYEAIGKVRSTSLKEFLFRGRDGGFAVYRLQAEHRQYIPATMRSCEKYLGRPYDYRYQLDDESIYCSELIYKSFRDATNGQQLGELSKFGEMNWQPFETLIKRIEGGTVPVNREMITPRDLAHATQLEPVFLHRLSAE